MQKFTVPVLLLAALAALCFGAQSGMMNLYVQSVIMFMGINIILSSSLNIVNGYMGEFACGHAGFMAVGAYVSSILSVWLFADDAVFGTAVLSPSLAVWLFPVVILAGGVAAAFAGLLVAVPSFKTRGDYLAIITIAANYIVKSTIENVGAIGGARGFMGMGRVTKAMDASLPLPWMMIWVFAGTVMTVWLINRFVSSTQGKGIIAICQDEIAAEIMSVNTNKMKIVAFMLSSGLAGVAGGLFAHVLGYVNPGSFTIMKSTECMVMVYLGGMGSLGGSVLSAVLFTLLLEALRPLQIIKWVVIPLMLVLLMQFRPEGIMGNRELPQLFPKLKKFYKFK
ncbi:MAG: branched-chain amino acid ABC transporter permease [Desulfovibrionaceae bacterium]|nr:branched-chain amino acid ABC transporter permease [Desulfovibrionaceae bacterium]